MQKMQLTQRERSAEWALEQFQDCQHAFLAMNGPDGTPYNIPMCCVVYNGKIYFHGALSGLKNTLLEQDGRVCFSTVTWTERQPSSFTIRFRSAIATGIATEVTEYDEIFGAMKAYNLKYIPDGDMEYATNRMASGRTRVYRIDNAELIGKESLPSDDV